jgi:hypothetical protein
MAMIAALIPVASCACCAASSACSVCCSLASCFGCAPVGPSRALAKALYVILFAAAASLAIALR